MTSPATSICGGTSNLHVPHTSVVCEGRGEINEVYSEEDTLPSPPEFGTNLTNVESVLNSHLLSFP